MSTERHAVPSNMVGDWHREMQAHFRPDVEVPFKMMADGTKSRRADAVCVNDVVVEFQHSPIPVDEVKARESDYGGHGMRVVWVIDGNGARTVVHSLDTSSTYMLVFLDTWQYASFLHSKDGVDQGYLYLEREGMVYRFAPREVRSSMIDVRRPVGWTDFVKAMKDGSLDSIWDDTPLPQSTLYHVQRGAGNGKTHDSIQLICSDKGCLGRKTTLLYLTKAHTAKSVICDELREQNARGKLVAAVVPGSLAEHRSGKHIHFEFDRTIDGARVNITVGTIDSFMYAMGNKNAAKKTGGDVFAAHRESIKNGHKAYSDTSGYVQFAKRDLRLNKNCMIVIDEAQDLSPDYIEAIARIQRDTYIDVFVIGDKLQSIWYTDNVFTHLEREGLPHVNTHVIGGDNVIRRFHRRSLVDVVNGITPFHLHEHPGHPLPHVSGMCDGCEKYAWAHALDRTESPSSDVDDDEPLVLFDQPDDRENVANTAEKLTNMVSRDVERHAYLPENIMFIFPFVANNSLAACLETRLINFWMSKFSDSEYQRRARLAEHPYWGKHLEDGDFHNYAFLHKSEENRPINLEESEHSTRILSIHASKGQGCEVVYLMGLSEEALKIFSKGEINLIYESLLHVAVTRQKLGLRVGLPAKDDDVRRRFSRLASQSFFEADGGKGGYLANDKINSKDIVSQMCSDRDTCKCLNDAYFLPLRLHEKVPSSSWNADTTSIVEWGHHIVRYTTLRYAVLCEIAHATGDSSQVDAIIGDIVRARPCLFRHKEYYQALYKINDENDRACKSNRDNDLPPTVNLSKDLPILEYDEKERGRGMYAKYRETFVKYVRHVQQKMIDARRRNNETPDSLWMPNLCPVEACVFAYVQEVLRNGVYSSIKVNDVYKLLDSVHRSGVSHTGYGCMCDGKRTSGPMDDDAATKSRRTADVQHFDALVHVRPMFASFLVHVVEVLGEDPRDLKYNVDHVVRFVGRASEFTMWDKLPFVVHGKRVAVIISLKPTFGALSSHVDFTEALIQTFVTAHPPVDTNNARRFAGKRVLVCFFTFTSPHPVWIDMGEEPHYDVFCDCLSHTLKRKYRLSNPVLLASVGKACRRACVDTQTPDPKRTFEVVEEIVETQLKGGNLPDYMSEFITCIKQNARKKRRIDDDLLRLGTSDDNGGHAEDLEEMMCMSVDDWLSSSSSRENTGK